MKYGNIPESILDYPFFFTIDGKLDSLRDHLRMSEVQEDIIKADWSLAIDKYGKEDTLEYFVAWTENYIVYKLTNSWGEPILEVIDRHPTPDEPRAA